MQVRSANSNANTGRKVYAECSLLDGGRAIYVVRSLATLNHPGLRALAKIVGTMFFRTLPLRNVKAIPIRGTRSSLVSFVILYVYFVMLCLAKCVTKNLEVTVWFISKSKIVGEH